MQKNKRERLPLPKEFWSELSDQPKQHRIADLQKRLAEQEEYLSHLQAGGEETRYYSYPNGKVPIEKDIKLVESLIAITKLNINREQEPVNEDEVELFASFLEG